MMSAESLKLRPYTSGPSMPKVILHLLVYADKKVQKLTYPRILELIDAQTVKML